MPELTQEQPQTHETKSFKTTQRWMRRKGIQKPNPEEIEKNKFGIIKSSIQEKLGIREDDPIRGYIDEAYDLVAEKEDLKANIVRGLIKQMGGPAETPEARRAQRDELALKTEQILSGSVNEETQSQDSLERKRQLINSGRIDDLLSGDMEDFGMDIKSEDDAGALSSEIVAESQKRITEIDTRFDELMRKEGVFEGFQMEMIQEVSLRKKAREAYKLNKYLYKIDVITAKLARKAQVEGRSLTSAEKKLIDNNEALKTDIEERRSTLLSDEEVAAKLRIIELKEYKRQLRRDRFAETPSRVDYLRRVATAWSEGKRVLLTGETGTGKTEIIKHASRELFGMLPEYVTGHQDLSIYELLGKTGFNVQVGDEFKPAPLVRAMSGRGGKGMPFLFDEIDRAPNQAVMGIKTLLNVRPGETGIKVQTDSNGEISVGPDYAVSATANIKSKRYATATELDPAIVRVFDAPIDIDYMPAYEVWDLAVATLMDSRGNIPLTNEEAGSVLKNLCDAADWIQHAYQGKKVVTNEQTGATLSARGQATRGEGASLQKALLDPGRTLDMLSGWQSARAKGTGFRDYLGERIVDFINNRAYPDDDRYYLVEIFALKGFLKGRKASEFLVSDLNQSTLDSWNGGGA